MFFRRTRNVLPDLPETQLPEAYAMNLGVEVAVTELQRLGAAVLDADDYDATEFDAPTRTDYYWLDHFHAGVREQSGELVGYGRLTYPAVRTIGRPCVATMGFLMVHPEHQNRGIGTALVIERLRFADRTGLHVTMPWLESTNTIAEKYQEFGFRLLRDGSYYRP